MTALTGLTSSDVAQRRQQGEGNTIPTSTVRTHWDIVRTNLFSNYNLILFGMAGILTVLGRFNDAFLTVSAIIFVLFLEPPHRFLPAGANSAPTADRSGLF